MWAIGLIGFLTLVAAIPYVSHIRHPDQKPFAAYLLFASIFLSTSVVLFGLLTWLLDTLGVGSALGNPFVALLFLLLLFLPALTLSSWQARKPPIKRSPPG